MKKKIFDLDKEINDNKKRLKSQIEDLEKEKVKTDNESEKIDELTSKLKDLAKKTEVDINVSHKKIISNNSGLEWDDLFFLNDNPLLLETRIKKEIFKNPKLLPKLNNLDIIILSLAGVIASLLDIFLVKLPKDINYLGKHHQKGSGFTNWLKTIGINDSGELKGPFKWFEKTCKVPYDTSTNKTFQDIGLKGVEGLNPRQHRMLSLGHDPLFGLIFGTYDIFNGSLTAIDTTGRVQTLKTFASGVTDKIFAPFLWLGHIVSDICTKTGIPIPGWGFSQILRFGSFGKKNRTVAEISRWMFLNGYDLRHFLSMSISPASIEIIVRAYHYLSNLEVKEQLENTSKNSLSTRELSNIQLNLKLHKMLFLSHSIAASGNALKIFVHQGNPLAINIPQWVMFLKESVKMAKGILRDKTPEKIIRNRKKINDEWDRIKEIKIGELELFNIDSSTYNEIYS